MKKSTQVKYHSQQEMFDLLAQMSHLFGFTIYKAVSPHGWFISPTKDRTITLQSGAVEVKVDHKLIAYEKKAISKLLNARFTSEKKVPDKKPKEFIYEFTFMKERDY